MRWIIILSVLLGFSLVSGQTLTVGSDFSDYETQAVQYKERADDIQMQYQQQIADYTQEAWQWMQVQPTVYPKGTPTMLYGMASLMGGMVLGILIKVAWQEARSSH